MAANQGVISAIIHARPAAGRNARSQRTERSRIDNASAVSPTNMMISGPLTSTPPAIAVHKIAGSRQPLGSSGARRCAR